MKVSFTATFQPGTFQDINLSSMYPTCGTEFPTTIGYRWPSNYAGPESRDMTIKILEWGKPVAAAIIGVVAKDVAEWAKEKLLPVLKQKKRNLGVILLSFEKVTIRLDTSYPNSDIVPFLDASKDILSLVDEDFADTWEASIDDDCVLKVTPDWSSVAEKIEARTGQRPDYEQVQTLIEIWRESRS